MIRNDHRLMIEQNVDGESHWTTIRLMDKEESKDGKSVTGSWKPTDESYNVNPHFRPETSHGRWYATSTDCLRPNAAIAAEDHVSERKNTYI